jgi:hypothetical protein
VAVPFVTMMYSTVRVCCDGVLRSAHAAAHDARRFVLREVDGTLPYGMRPAWDRVCSSRPECRPGSYRAMARDTVALVRARASWPARAGPHTRQPTQHDQSGRIAREFPHDILLECSPIRVQSQLVGCERGRDNGNTQGRELVSLTKQQLIPRTYREPRVAARDAGSWCRRPWFGYAATMRKRIDSTARCERSSTSVGLARPRRMR